MESPDEWNKQLLCVCEDLGREVPGCEHLLHEYKDFWIPGDFESDESELWREIKTDVRMSITGFLKEADEDDINVAIDSLNPATQKWLAQPGNLPWLYRYYFRRIRPYATLPNDFVAPNIFQAINRNEGSYIRLSRPIRRQYGRTVVELSGCLLSAYDALILTTLIRLKNYKKIEKAGKSISFRTSLLEITEMIEFQNPYSQNSQRAVWNSLKRLAGVVVEITNVSGKRTIGHILDGAEEIDDLEIGGRLDVEADLRIYMDRYFLNLEEKNFTMLDPEILHRLKSKPRALCTYLFLSRQRDFYKGKWWYIGIAKLHDYAGLRPHGKRQGLIQREVCGALDQLKMEKVLTWEINKSRQLISVHSGDRQALKSLKWT